MAEALEVTGSGDLAPKNVKVKEKKKQTKLVLVFEYELTDEHDIQIEHLGDEDVAVAINGERVQEWKAGRPVDPATLKKKIKGSKLVVCVPKEDAEDDDDEEEEKKKKKKKDKKDKKGDEEEDDKEKKKDKEKDEDKDKENKSEED